MTSKRKQLKAIRENKKKPNKRNLKADTARFQDNIQKLKELADESKD